MDFPRKGRGETKSGTGFAVSPTGHILTANHVVEGSSSIKVKFEGSDITYEARFLQSSKSNDLALLSIEKQAPKWRFMAPTKKSGVGAPIFTLGYPATLILGAEPKFTDGSTVSALSGVGGEASFFQMSVAIQPGNSGGPVVNNDGIFVGVVTSTAAIKSFNSYTGTLPQNVNWGIKSDYAIVLFDQPEKSYSVTSICIDRGGTKRTLVEKLESFEVSFIDVGMGLYVQNETLHGILRVTTSTPQARGHVHEKERIPFADGDGDDEYASNIQVADLNALNAMLAIVKWKKLCGFYGDFEQEHFSAFALNGNSLVNEDSACGE
jgi:S1-C subfamily serine protease